MATSEYLSKPKVRKSGYPSQSLPRKKSVERRPSSQARATAITMMASDVLAVLFALCLASIFRFDGAIFPSAKFQSGLPTHVLPMQPGYLLLFIITLLIVNRRDGLYGPLQRQSSWHELRRTIQACLTAGLLLCGSMYVMHDTSVSRAVVGYLLVLSALFLCLLRAFWRHSLYRRYKRGMDTRNVLIVGPTQMGRLLCKRIAGNTYLGRNFKGYVQTRPDSAEEETREHVLGDLNELERLVRQHFIDEIIIAEPCGTQTVLDLADSARELDVELLVLPSFYEELTPESPIEYLADFPVVALHRRNARVFDHLLKQIWDRSISTLLLLMLLPTLLLIALFIKLDTPGPIFFSSDRVGKKGRIFHCLKFRTMVINAEELKQSLAHRNERDGVLFKIKDDPRITRVGRILRKFSLDELPQLLNVLNGDMSLVGPRPPIASEVQCYELRHLRRLEVLPGLTGLWQVRAREDPSFERYVGLDLAYVENWSFWLDLKILARTAEVVFRGTGS